MTGGFSSKNVLVTGASSGIGYQAALDLAGKGAYIIGTGRDVTRCEAARTRILQVHPEAQIEYLVADLASQTQIHDLARQAQLLLIEHGNRLDVLVNNAGLYSSKRVLTEDGIELTFAVNHLAPFLLTHLLLPQLLNTPQGRVLGVSSQSHYHAFLSPLKAYRPWLYLSLPVYATSNLCRVLFSAEFNRRTPTPHLHAWSVDPGLVNTEIGQKDKGFLSNLVWRFRKTHGTSAEIPSQTILHLAFSAFHYIAADLYWKDSRPKEPSRLSRDAELAKRLWEQSCRLCGIDDYFNPG